MSMKREKLIRGIRRFAKGNDTVFDVETRRGKGSHVRVMLGESRTIIKTGELSDVYVDLILKQLGIPKDAIRR